MCGAEATGKLAEQDGSSEWGRVGGGPEADDEQQDGDTGRAVYVTLRLPVCFPVKLTAGLGLPSLESVPEMGCFRRGRTHLQAVSGGASW